MEEEDVGEERKKKKPLGSLHFCWQAKTMLCKVWAQHYYAEWSATAFFASPFPLPPQPPARHPHHPPTRSFLPLASRPFSSFSLLRGCSAPRPGGMLRPLWSSLHYRWRRSLAPSKSGLPVVVLVSGGGGGGGGWGEARRPCTWRGPWKAARHPASR